MRSQFSHETMEELRKRVLDLEEQNRVLDAFIENSTDAIQISDRLMRSSPGFGERS